MDKTVKITKENYQKVDQIARHQRRSRKTILAKAIENYYNCTILNTLRTKK